MHNSPTFGQLLEDPDGQGRGIIRHTESQQKLNNGGIAVAFNLVCLKEKAQLTL